MSLKDLAKESTYPSIKRYIHSKIGKKWDAVFSEICGAASADSERGRQLRRSVDWLVDVKGADAIHPNDYYVDPAGILREAIKPGTWRKRYAKRINESPITKIQFVGDPDTVWYELVSVSHGPEASKYSYKGQNWFRMERVYRKDSYPIYEYVNGRQGRQIGAKETTKEELHKSQVGGNALKVLKNITAKEVKILRLTYTKNTDHWTSQDTHHLTAYVKGKIDD